MNDEKDNSDLIEKLNEIEKQNKLLQEKLSKIELQASLQNTEKAKQTTYKTEQVFNSYNPVLGMKWYHFIIYFGLFATALSYLASGIMLATGAIYVQNGIDLDFIYYTFPSLPSLNVFFGLLTISMAFYAIFVRFKLADFKIDAPKMFYILYIIDISLSLIYNFVTALIIGSWELFNVSSIISIIFEIVMIIINYNYFEKRKHLFINKAKNS